MKFGDKLRVEKGTIEMDLRFKRNQMRYTEVEIAAKREGERWKHRMSVLEWGLQTKPGNAELSIFSPAVD